MKFDLRKGLAALPPTLRCSAEGPAVVTPEPLRIDAWFRATFQLGEGHCYAKIKRGYLMR